MTIRDPRTSFGLSLEGTWMITRVESAEETNFETKEREKHTHVRLVRSCTPGELAEINAMLDIEDKEIER